MKITFRMSALTSVLIYLCLCVSAFGVIIESSDLSVLEREIAHLDKQALVLFDVDYTLLFPKDMILRPCGRVLKRKLMKETLENPKVVPIGKYSDGYLRSRAILQAKTELVDPKIVQILAVLKKKDVPTIALTMVESGRLGVIPNMADWRIGELAELGLQFDWSFLDLGYLQFPKDTNRDSFPAYKSGVLFSARHAKGPILKTFLDKLNWKPSRILFMDDNRSYLQSVEAVAMERGIPFVGILYSGASQVPCQVDEKIAQFQFLHLANHGDWLTDQEAAEKIRAKK